MAGSAKGEAAAKSQSRASAKQLAPKNVADIWSARPRNPASRRRLFLRGGVGDSTRKGPEQQKHGESGRRATIVDVISELKELCQSRVADAAKNHSGAGVESALSSSHEGSVWNESPSEEALTWSREAVLRGCGSPAAATAFTELGRSTPSDAFYDADNDEFDGSLYGERSAKSNTMSARLRRCLREAAARGCRLLCAASAAGEDGADEDALFAPEAFHRVPLFALIAMRLDFHLFSRIVYFFFQRKRWPLFSELPSYVQYFCNTWGIDSGDYHEMPAFAPEWLFHLQLMDNKLFWTVLHYFFRHNRFPSWDLIPPLYTDWFRMLELGEFEYPSITKYNTIPDNVKRRYKIMMEGRLRLTEKQFPPGKDHFMVETSADTELV